MGGEIGQLTAWEAASVLGWWLDAGVDTLVDEAPRDWLNPAPVVKPSVAVEAPRSPEPVPQTLDLFRDWLGASSALPMASATAKRIMPRGVENAPVMLIADMPNAEDGAEGTPIGGQAWALTVRMLAAIGIDAADAYLANLSCFHAPGSRMKADDLEACAEIARRHVALARPKRLLLLGDAPARALTGKPLAAARGHVHKVEGVRTIVTFHPRYLLERPSYKALAWQDLLLLMEDEA